MPNDIDLTLPQNGLGDDCAPCGLHRPLRNAYYDGKMLTARDLMAEQTYMNGMRHLGNMMLEGKGTVCGLKVVQHPQEDCRDSHMVLQAGMALSCCGQEIVVPKDVTIPVLVMLQDDPDLQEALQDGSNELVVELCRDDVAAEMGPVLISDCCSGLDGQLPSRIAEDFGFRLKAVPKGATTIARAVLEPDLNWVHSINSGDEVPTVVSVDEESDLVFVAGQADNGDAGSVAAVRAYSMTTHRHVATLVGWEKVSDIVAPAVGSFMFVAGRRGGNYQIAAYPRNPEHQADFIHRQELSGPAQLAVSSVSGALFSLEYNVSNNRPRVRAWSAEQVEGGFSDVSFNKFSQLPMKTTAFEAGCRAIEVSPDGQRLAFLLPGVGNSTLRVAEVSEVLSDGLPNLNATRIVIKSENGSDITDAYASTASVRFAFDGEVIHCTGRDLDELDRATYRAVSISENGYTQLGGGLVFDFPDETGLQPALFVAPDERWIYVCTASNLVDGTGQEDGRLWAFATKEAHAPGTALVDGTAVSTVPLNAQTGGGAIRLRGQRIYVPGTQRLVNDDLEVAPIVGRVMVVDITEADIKGMFEEAINGCSTCGEACCCVTLAHLPDYIFNAEEPMRMVDAGNGLEGEAEIDNLTYRHIVPSNTTLMEAILEIAARGVDAGPPGPRGRDGESGSNGSDGDDGDDGLDAPRIVAVSYQDIPSPVLQPENGVGPDLELLLPEPLGGGDGDRGGSVQEVVYDTNIDEPDTIDIPNDPEGDQRLLLPIPIENVVYRSVPLPTMGQGAEDRTLILPQPEVGTGGGTPPRDPSEYHHVESVDWANGSVFSLGGIGQAPPPEMNLTLNIPVKDRDVAFTDLGAEFGFPNLVELFSGVLEIRVHVHDGEYNLDPPSWNPFNVARVKTLRYSPRYVSRDQALKNNRTFSLKMSELWDGLTSYWDRLDGAKGRGRARVEIVLHGNFLANDNGWPFDGRHEPNVPVELAGETGGTWRSWIDVIQS